MDKMKLTELPKRMFAHGEEPVGIRVTSYTKTNGIQLVLSSLEQEEIIFLRNSNFGKFIGLADKEPFSGRFCRYIMSRLLKVKKKHEIWILFGGKPIRFSLREFAIVKGLPCGKYPKKCKPKLKNLISEKSNWDNLFGKLSTISVESVLAMLKNKTVTDKVTRIKYACLALLASVLLPTTHTHKIDREHAELIKDLDDFFCYPWGRLGFDLMMGSIKERDEVSLSQNTVAIKGFVQALQLVVLEAVPGLTDDLKVVHVSSSDSEADDGQELGDEDYDNDGRKVVFTPAHARNINKSRNVLVHSIIQPPEGVVIDETAMEWPDEVVDIEVVNMLAMINNKQKFSEEFFVGGATKADVIRMRKEVKEKKESEKRERENAGKAKLETMCSNEALVEKLSDLVAAKIKDDIHERLDDAFVKLSEVKALVRTIKSDGRKELKSKIGEMEGNIMAGIQRFMTKTGGFCGSKSEENACGGPHKEKVQQNNHDHPVANISGQEANCGSSVGHVGSSKVGRSVKKTGLRHQKKEEDVKIKDSVLMISSPSFSLGLSQDEDEEKTFETEEINNDDCDSVADVMKFKTVDATDGENCHPIKRRRTRSSPLFRGKEVVHSMRLSKRAKRTSMSQTRGVDYDVKFARLMEKLCTTTFGLAVGGVSILSDEILDLINRNVHLTPKIMDVLISLTHILYKRKEFPIVSPTVQFLDTEDVSSLCRNYSKYKNLLTKQSHKFNESLVPWLRGYEAKEVKCNRYYFPFNFDKKHWVGVCVDIAASTVFVLDCHTSLRSSTAITSELQPIAHLFPLLYQKIFGVPNRGSLKNFEVVRVKSIPQNTNAAESGLTSVLLIQAHAIAGSEAAACIMPDALDVEVRKLAVLLYEVNGEEL